MPAQQSRTGPGKEGVLWTAPSTVWQAMPRTKRSASWRSCRRARAKRRPRRFSARACTRICVSVHTPESPERYDGTADKPNFASEIARMVWIDAGFGVPG